MNLLFHEALKLFFIRMVAFYCLTCNAGKNAAYYVFGNSKYPSYARNILALYKKYRDSKCFNLHSFRIILHYEGWLLSLNFNVLFSVTLLVLKLIESNRHS